MSYNPNSPSTPVPYISVSGTNPFVIKSSPGVLTGVLTDNTGASPVYLRIYDKATNPTVGTDTPKWIICIPANTSGAGNNPSLPSGGINFVNGIAIAITANRALLDSTTITAGNVTVNLAYQ